MQILLLIVHGSRVPLWVFICFAGNRSVIKKFLVGASLVFSALVLMCYYLGSDNIFARGITVRRTLYDAVASNNTAAVSYMLAQPGLGGARGGEPVHQSWMTTRAVGRLDIQRCTKHAGRATRWWWMLC